MPQYFQPSFNPTQKKPKPTQPMDGPNPCPSLLHVPHVKTDYLLRYYWDNFTPIINSVSVILSILFILSFVLLSTAHRLRTVVQSSNLHGAELLLLLK